jgi:ABC-type polysaccharide/polyol phosphate export permease
VRTVRRFDREYLELLGTMTITEFRRANRRSLFGMLWSVMSPFLMVLVLFAIFSARFAREIESYPLYLLAGVVPYSYFASATGSSVAVLQSMKSLTLGAIFPKEILVLGTVLSRTLDFALSIAFCAIIAVVAGLPVRASFYALPGIVLLALLLTLWVSLLLSMTYVFVRDVRPIYQVFLRILFVVTPIFYAPSLLGDVAARWVVDFNPLATVIQFTRSALIEGRAPAIGSVLAFAAFNVLLVAVCLTAFRRLEPAFGERV